MKRNKVFPAALAAAGLLLSVCMHAEAKQKDYTAANFFFDTVISLRITADENGQELLNHCMDMCRNYEHIFSRTDESSELYAVNHRDTDTVEVSDELAYLIGVGLEYYEISEKKFDITVAPLSDLWDFKSPDASIPDAEDIAKEAAKVDASKVHLDGNTLSFDSRDTMIDLGALVKGYAADEMAAYLKSEGVSSGLINLGGNVLTIGSKPDGSMWRIGIRKPFDSDAIIDTVEVSDKTVVTSGVYERYFEQDGVIYHHILDPDTGYPIENLQGDALSTTCLALGVEKASKLIESLDGVEAVFINDRLELTKAGEAD